MLKLKTSLLPVTAALFSASVMSHGYVSAIDGGRSCSIVQIYLCDRRKKH
ncbi:hypothetical protein SAMN02745132_04214 [Enterovibrio nigricans DSM 22720]|uniref:Uncharacterized protein n=1 Tax=Enterovibrio nigricans DSM 22720 TaxID=1121868 RepID=A0A1T4VRF0_9GAMM|nr:hypothetical protein SAMN02745132_04214 [Enterovibrio nigricans DSM 22720]